MTINILAFGIAKEIMGAAQAGVVVAEAVCVEDLKSQLEQQFPRLKELKSFMIAVNGEYAKPGQMIMASDEVAIIPPVSGG
jgi:molybdopterin synthase sulfur carrier subunit